MLACYFSFSQVYFHRVRRIYDIHLKDFLKAWLAPDGGYLPHEPEGHLKLTDNEVLAAIHTAAREGDEPICTLARRVVERGERYALVYEPTPDDLSRNADAGKQVAHALAERYGERAVSHDRYGRPTTPFDFAVMRRDRKVVSSTGMSEVLAKVPAARFDYVFLDRQHKDDAEQWLKEQHDDLIEPLAIEDEDEAPPGEA